MTEVAAWRSERKVEGGYTGKQVTPESVRKEKCVGPDECR